MNDWKQASIENLKQLQVGDLVVFDSVCESNNLNVRLINKFALDNIGTLTDEKTMFFKLPPRKTKENIFAEKLAAYALRNAPSNTFDAYDFLPMIKEYTESIKNEAD